MNKFCCEQFDWCFSEAGKAGLSIIIRLVHDEVGFFLQGRVCEMNQEYKLSGLSQEECLPTPFRAVAQVGIRFCPFCGTKLQKSLVNLRREEIEKLVLEHQRYVLGPVAYPSGKLYPPSEPERLSKEGDSRGK